MNYGHTILGIAAAYTWVLYTIMIGLYPAQDIRIYPYKTPNETPQNPFYLGYTFPVSPSGVLGQGPIRFRVEGLGFRVKGSRLMGSALRLMHAVPRTVSKLPLGDKTTK